MSLFNEDELTAPSWVNKEFLENVLKQYENNEKIQIVSYDMSPASMKGDHYASIMFRCNVNYTSSPNADSVLKRSLILKTLPEAEGMKRELLMDTKLFETEIQMFSQTLGKFEKILADHGEPTKLSAGYIYSALEPHKVIIFEDLCELGYNTVRDRMLTEDEVKAVYTKLAKFHAVSYLLAHSEEASCVTKYQEGIFNMSTQLTREMMDNGIKNFLELLQSEKEFSCYYEKVKAMEPIVKEQCKKLYNAAIVGAPASRIGPKDIFVLNHGDFHMKNLMFKFNEQNQLDDAIMVDYQISVYAPVTIDLIYSHYMLLSPDLRLKKHELMRFYFTQFLNTLKKLNYAGELPKYSEFQISCLKYRYFSVFLVATFLPMVDGMLAKTVEDLKDVEMGDVFEDQQKMKDMYRSPEYLDDLRKWLPVLLNEGYLD